MRAFIGTSALSAVLIGSTLPLIAPEARATHDSVCQIQPTSGQRTRFVSCNPRQICFNATPGNMACNLAPDSGQCPVVENYNPRQECIANLPPPPSVSIASVEGGPAGGNRAYSGTPAVMRVLGQNVGMAGNSVVGESGLVVGTVPFPGCAPPGCLAISVLGAPNVTGAKRFTLRTADGHSQAEGTVQLVAPPPAPSPQAVWNALPPMRRMSLQRFESPDGSAPVFAFGNTTLANFSTLYVRGANVGPLFASPPVSYTPVPLLEDRRLGVVQPQGPVELFWGLPVPACLPPNCAVLLVRAFNKDLRLGYRDIWVQDIYYSENTVRSQMFGFQWCDWGNPPPLRQEPPGRLIRIEVDAERLRVLGRDYGPLARNGQELPVRVIAKGLSSGGMLRFTGSSQVEVLGASVIAVSSGDGVYPFRIKVWNDEARPGDFTCSVSVGANLYYGKDMNRNTDDSASASIYSGFRTNEPPKPVSFQQPVRPLR